MSISKAGPATANVGDEITYTLTYGNAGVTDATNVLIQDPMPQATFVSATNGGFESLGTVNWNIGTLAHGVTGQTVQFTVRPVAGISTITNAGYFIIATGATPATGPDVVTSIGAVKLSISKAGPATANVGDEITYTITYGNTGSADAANLLLQDPMPQATFVSATNGGFESLGTVNWNIGTLAHGVTGQTVQFTVRPVAGISTITNAGYFIVATGAAPATGPAVITTIGSSAVPALGPTTRAVFSILLAAVGFFLVKRITD